MTTSLAKIHNDLKTKLSAVGDATANVLSATAAALITFVDYNNAGGDFQMVDSENENLDVTTGNINKTVRAHVLRHAFDMKEDANVKVALEDIYKKKPNKIDGILDISTKAIRIVIWNNRANVLCTKTGTKSDVPVEYNGRIWIKASADPDADHAEGAPDAVLRSVSKLNSIASAYFSKVRPAEQSSANVQACERLLRLFDKISTGEMTLDDLPPKDRFGLWSLNKEFAVHCEDIANMDVGEQALKPQDVVAA